MKHYTIRCPNCGAPLEILGGRSVQSITCVYCGSVIDLTQHYKIVAKFQNIKLSYYPIQLGMVGKIHRIKFTVIGFVAYSTQKNSKKIEWVDYALHSPIYGYAWLTYENGTFVFSRRIRKSPNVNMKRLHFKDSFKFEDRKYRIYEKYNSYVVSVGGSLTYIAKQGDYSFNVEAISPPYGIAYEESRDEIEYYKMEYIPSKDIYEGFGIKRLPREEEFHPLKPFDSPKLKSLAQISAVFLFIAILAIYGIFKFASGDKIVESYMNAPIFKRELNIKNSAPKLLRVNVYANVSNAYRDFTLYLYDSNGNIVYNTVFEISYYHGIEDGESWTEGTQEEDIYIRLKTPGRYTLIVTQYSFSKGMINKITLYDGVLRYRYFLTLLIISIIGMLSYFIAYLQYKSRLWGEEDDE